MASGGFRVSQPVLQLLRRPSSGLRAPERPLQVGVHFSEEILIHADVWPRARRNSRLGGCPKESPPGRWHRPLHINAAGQFVINSVRISSELLKMTSSDTCQNHSPKCPDTNLTRAPDVLPSRCLLPDIRRFINAMNPPHPTDDDVHPKGIPCSPPLYRLCLAAISMIP